MKIKKLWNTVKLLCILGFAFWVIETAYFLIIYGWHWSAINEYEKFCDTIVASIYYISILLFMVLVFEIIDRIISNIEK